jgi:hypothetical protein
MMRDLFRESRDLNARIRFTVKYSGRTLVARAKARLAAIVGRCLLSLRRPASSTSRRGPAAVALEERHPTGASDQPVDLSLRMFTIEPRPDRLKS